MLVCGIGESLLVASTATSCGSSFGKPTAQRSRVGSHTLMDYLVTHFTHTLRTLTSVHFDHVCQAFVYDCYFVYDLCLFFGFTLPWILPLIYLLLCITWIVYWLCSLDSSACTLFTILPVFAETSSWIKKMDIVYLDVYLCVLIKKKL